MKGVAKFVIFMLNLFHLALILILPASDTKEATVRTIVL